MSNQLLNADLWSDGYFNTPPYWWNGTSYDIDDTNNHSGVGSVLVSTGIAGNVISFTLDNLVAITDGESNSLILKINNVLVATFPLGVVGSTDFTSAVLSAGDEISFECVEISDGSPYNIYGCDFTIKPSPDTFSSFWTDLIGCTQR